MGPSCESRVRVSTSAVLDLTLATFLLVESNPLQNAGRDTLVPTQSVYLVSSKNPAHPRQRLPKPVALHSEAYTSPTLLSLSDMIPPARADHHPNVLEPSEHQLLVLPLLRFRCDLCKNVQPGIAWNIWDFVPHQE